jgi:hypothetical protein
MTPPPFDHARPPRSCATCEFTEVTTTDDTNEPVLQCRRRPPQLMAIGEVVQQSWPQMDAQDWCGEWTPSPDDASPTG